MGDHVTDRPATTKQRWQIATDVIGNALFDASLTFADAEEILKNKKKQRIAAREVLAALGITLSAKHPAAEALEQYFHKVFGYTIDLAGIQFPEKEGFATWMAVPPELDEDRIVESLAKHFNVNTYKWQTPIVANIDHTLAQKRPSGLYVFAHRGGDEPDDIHRNKSYDQAMAEGFPFTNLKEYLLMTGFHRFVNNCFMDRKCWTRTSSLWLDGCLVRVDWNDAHAKLYLNGGYRDDAGPEYGPRELFLG